MSGDGTNNPKSRSTGAKLPKELERELRALEGKTPKNYRHVGLSSISGLAVEVDPVEEIAFTERLTHELMQIVSETVKLTPSQYLKMELRLKRLINCL
jgi:hypothetical protein